ncbi:MAG: D-sedoheptulose 7-phosphate isomerase [Solirubrobacteraceae bacterium]
MADAEATIRRRITESLEAKRALLEDGVVVQVAQLAETITAALRDGNKVLFFGNGGSAADATHLASEFVGRFLLDREPLNAISLTDNGSSVSAIGNDYAYDQIFARQIRALGRAGDVAVGLSTSGRSRNVVEGLRAAGQAGLRTAALTGADGGELPEVVDLCLRMPAQETARVQECSMLVGHTVCELVEASLFDS